MRRKNGERTICFVTGTRAEFGLMRNTLRAIGADERLKLQLIVTGMHLDRAQGHTITQIRREGWRIDAAIRWKPAGSDLTLLAQEAGRATARLAAAYAKLQPDIVLVVGDRVEAFAAATAAHLSGKIVAHIHGGDRALGQVDDALRHAITKLAHIHFPATRESAQRIAKLGEDVWRIHKVGSPGLDGIRKDASLPMYTSAHTLVSRSDKYILFLLHPTTPDNASEYRRAKMLLRACLESDFERFALIYPNSDPGSAGIVRAIDESKDLRIIRQSVRHHVSRAHFLGMLRDAAVLAGNSSSGIIEAASFGTPVIDVGPRQAGRERGKNVISAAFETGAIRAALGRVWNGGRPRRFGGANIYGDGKTAGRIVEVLAGARLDEKLRRKLIAY